jgi:hypothetical protein
VVEPAFDQHPQSSSVLAVLTAAAMAVAISGALAWATTGSGTQSTLVGRATLDEAFQVHRKIRSAEGATGSDGQGQARPRHRGSNHRLRARRSEWLAFPSGARLHLRQKGKMTFYEPDDPDCQPVVRCAGQGYLDTGKHAHIARNETSVPATNVVTYFAPPGAALRIDEPGPGHCPF